MEAAVKMKTIKEIVVDVDKCSGCRACEMVCSSFHAKPRYSSVNPARSRIRVLCDERKDIYVPVRATHYVKSECTGRQAYTTGGKIYRQCGFCGASCPSRDYFKEPDSGLPLKCDMCECTPPVEEPLCVKVCSFDALIYVEREVDDCVEEVNGRRQLDIGLDSLVDKYGLQGIMVTLARFSKKG